MMEIPKSEEGWLKLRYKDLQKIAKQRNINPKSKKVDIVKALLRSECTNFDIESSMTEQKENNINEAIENYSRGTITRSRTSMTSLTKNDVGTLFPDGDTNTENNPQKKRRGRRHLPEAVSSVDSQCVFVPIEKSKCIIKSKPLQEMSNTNSTEESDLNTKSGKQNTENTSKKKRGKLCLPQEVESEHVLKTDVVPNVCGIDNVVGKNEVNNLDDNKYNNKKGRKRRRPNENLVLAAKHSGEGFGGQTGQDERIKCTPEKRGRQKRLKQNAISNSVDDDVVAFVVEDNKSMQNNDMISKIPNCSDGKESVELPALTNKRRTHSITKQSATTDDTKPTHERPISNGSVETDTSNTVEENTMPVPAPLIRSSTFTLDTNDDHDETTASVSTTNNGKSIGKRIMAASIKRGAVMPSTSKSIGNGSSVKKTISKNSLTKNIGTPGSAYRTKFGVARKAPNFKKIHQKLFGNMESIEANQKRTFERGQKLIMSPAPSCAVPRKSLERDVTDKQNSTFELRKSLSVQEKKPVFTMGSTHKPSTSKVTNPAVNRFGFKNRTYKRGNVVGQKQPPVSLEKKKEQERSVIHGVRMNKRFMLQMQMRKNTN